MIFLKIKEYTEIYKDDRYVPIEADLFINTNQISMIRETKDGLSLFLVGRDKAIVIKDKHDIDTIMKELDLGRRSLKEDA